MSSPSSLPRFQFSLRWLLIAVTIVAVLLGFLSFQIGQILVGLCVFVVLRGIVPTAALAGAIYGRGGLRAFAIGALVPCVPVLTSGAEPWDRWGWGFVSGAAIHLAAIGICGVVAVVARRGLVGQEPSDVK
jgi:hypothetical protein